MSVSRGCTVIELEPGQWYCLLAITEYDYEFEHDYITHGPEATADEAVEGALHNQANPGCEECVPYADVTDRLRSLIERGTRNAETLPRGSGLPARESEPAKSSVAAPRVGALAPVLAPDLAQDGPSLRENLRRWQASHGKTMQDAPGAAGLPVNAMDPAVAVEALYALRDIVVAFLDAPSATPELLPVCVQQGGATWELYVQLPDDAEAYIQDCAEHTYEAVDCGTIAIRGKDKDGNDLVWLQDAAAMATACLVGACELIREF